MARWSIFILLSVMTGCASVNEQVWKEAPWVDKVRLSQPLEEREAYFEKMRVSGVNKGGSRVGGKLFADSAIRQHYKAFGSTPAIRLSREVTRHRITRIVGSIVPPIAGAVIGLYAGMLIWNSTYYSYGSGNSTYGAAPLIGAGVGALIGGLGIALPISLGQGSKIVDKRQEAAEVFNRHLKKRLKLGLDEAEEDDEPGAGIVDDSAEPGAAKP